MAIKINKYTTLTATLAAGATTGTLTSAAFDNGTQVPLHLEYDNTAKIEGILADINGTALTNIVRGRDGTSDIEHTGTPKIGQGSSPDTWKYWFDTVVSPAWTDWTPSIYKNDGTTALTSTLYYARYMQIGKMVFATYFFSFSADPGGALIYFTLPVAAKAQSGGVNVIGAGRVKSATTEGMGYTWIATDVTAKAGVLRSDQSAWGASGLAVMSITYEAG